MTSSGPVRYYKSAVLLYRTAIVVTTTVVTITGQSFQYNIDKNNVTSLHFKKIALDFPRGTKMPTTKCEKKQQCFNISTIIAKPMHFEVEGNSRYIDNTDMHLLSSHCDVWE